MRAEHRSFHDTLEQILYWDTTFPIAFTVPTDPWHAECEEFLSRLEAEAILSVTSDFVYDEFAFYLVKAALTAEGKRTAKGWLNVKREQPDFIARVMPDVEVAKTELDRVAMKLSAGDTVTEHAFRLMRNYSILPTDAYHIAIALDADVNSFVSLDADFLRVDDIIVYTCLP